MTAPSSYARCSVGFSFILWDLLVCSDVVEEGEARKVGVVGWAVGSEGACDAHVRDSAAMGLKQH